MIHRVIHIRGWRVDVFIDDGDSNGFSELRSCLIEMGAHGSVLEKAADMYYEYKPNEAFTYTNVGRSCVFIGQTTDKAEFINSVVHETRHLIDHIASATGIEMNGEDVGYMSGDTAYLLAEDICKMGCPCCGKGA